MNLDQGKLDLPAELKLSEILAKSQKAVIKKCWRQEILDENFMKGFLYLSHWSSDVRQLAAVTESDTTLGFALLKQQQTKAILSK
jgi:hypothetical protein